MFMLASSYDLTDYPAVRAVCIILTLILAGIVLAIAITNYIREGKAEKLKNVYGSEDNASVTEPSAEQTEKQAQPEAESAEEPSAEQTAEQAQPETESVEEPSAEQTEEQAQPEAESVEEPSAEQTAEQAQPEAESVVLEEAAAAVTETADEGSADETDYDSLPVFFDDMTRAMTEEERDAFAGLIAGEGRVHKTRLKYPLTSYEDEAAFLKDFFLSVSKFKAFIPTGAMEALYKERRSKLKTVSEKTRLNNKLIAFYFSRRKAEEDALEKCEKLCRKDVAFNYENRDVRGLKLPALKRLILICTAQKRYEEAIKLCDEAITREVIEKKDEGYEDRRSRIVGKMNRAAETAAAKAARAEARAAKKTK